MRDRYPTGLERPAEGRTFRHEELPEWVTENRGKLIWAVLTLVQNWLALGRPAGDYTLGSYEGWSKVVPGIVAAAGLRGFGGNVQQMRDAANDGSEDSMRRFWVRVAKQVIQEKNKNETAPGDPQSAWFRTGGEAGKGTRAEPFSIMALLADEAQNESEDSIYLAGWGYVEPRGGDGATYPIYTNSKKSREGVQSGGRVKAHRGNAGRAAV